MPVCPAWLHPGHGSRAGTGTQGWGHRGDFTLHVYLLPQALLTLQGLKAGRIPHCQKAPYVFFYKPHHFSPCNVNSLFPRMNSWQGARERGWWWAWGCGALQGWAQMSPSHQGRFWGNLALLRALSP